MFGNRNQHDDISTSQGASTALTRDSAAGRPHSLRKKQAEVLRSRHVGPRLARTRFNAFPFRVGRRSWAVLHIGHYRTCSLRTSLGRHSHRIACAYTFK